MTLNKVKVITTSWWHWTKVNIWGSIYTREKWSKKREKDEICQL